MRRLSMWFVAVSAAVVWAFPAVGFDEVQVSGKAVERGRILAMSPAEVTLDVQRRKMTFPVNEIVQINFDLEPLELKTARRFANGGQFEDALEKLDEIKLEEISRDFILADIAFFKAYCNAKLALGGAGRKEDAYRDIGAFISKYRDNYHYFRAVETYGDLAVAQELYEKAATGYAEVGKAPWASYKLRAKVLEGRALQAQNLYPQALKNYEMVLGVSNDIEGAEEQKLFAILGKAACLAALKKYDEGIKIVEDIVARGDSRDISLFANAYNTLGKCYLESGKPKDALLAYLHTHILFYGDPEAHAESLYHLANLWNQVDRPQRALDARDLLKSRYPGSRWNMKANR